MDRLKYLISTVALITGRRHRGRGWCRLRCIGLTRTVVAQAADFYWQAGFAASGITRKLMLLGERLTCFVFRSTPFMAGSESC